MIPALKDAIEVGKAKQADVIKVYVYKEDPDLFFLLDFEDDAIFLDPLLLAYYQYRFDCREQQRLPLSPAPEVRQLLWGYVPAAQRTVPVRVVTDAQGLLYLPNFGTARTTVCNGELALRWEPAQQAFTLWAADQPIPATWEPLATIADTRIEIWQHQHPLLTSLFRPSEAAPELAADWVPTVEVEAIAALKMPELRAAFTLLQRHVPAYFEQVRAAGRSVMLFHNPLVRPFVSIATLGASYLSTDAADSVLFYVTEIAHQFGHNVLGWTMLEPDLYFRVSPSGLLREHGGPAQDRRTLFSAFHGLYTTTLVAVCLEALLLQEVFTGHLRHELVGRLADNQRRFRSGFELVPHATVLTEAGQALYNALDETCAQVYARQQAQLSAYDVSNQRFVFSYPLFLQLNPLAPELAAC